MSDNLRRFMAVRTALLKHFGASQGRRFQRHATTLAALVAGIVAARHTHLSKVAQKVPQFGKPQSRIKRFSRFLRNETIDVAGYFMPLARQMVAALAHGGPLLLVVDGTQLGRGQVALVASVLYRRRALPVAWSVKQSRGTQFTQDEHRRLVEAVAALVPAKADVIFLGDGEFDGPELIGAIETKGWQFVCRTSKKTFIDDGHTCYSVGELTPTEDMTYLMAPQVAYTEMRYGPLQALLWHEPGYEDPIYLITNLEVAEEACHWYRHRAHVETLFSDQKSRGFRIERSHIADTERLGRLLMAAALAYIWVVYMGVETHRRMWVGRVHRTDRCDWSLFQLGLALLEYCLNENKTIPVNFRLPPPDSLQSVRW